MALCALTAQWVNCTARAIPRVAGQAIEGIDGASLESDRQFSLEFTEGLAHFTPYVTSKYQHILQLPITP